MGTIIPIILILLLVVAAYCIYQLIRNELVYNIRLRWIDKSDNRWYKYSYNQMFDPSPGNWFGLNWPHDSLYK